MEKDNELKVIKNIIDDLKVPKTKEQEYELVKKEVTEIMCSRDLTNDEIVNELSIFLGMMWNES